MSWIRSAKNLDASSGEAALDGDGPRRPNSSSAEPPERAEGAGSGLYAMACGSGWPAYWGVCVCMTTSVYIISQILPGLGLQYFNGWRGDPCRDVGNASEACQAASAELLNTKSTFLLLGQILSIAATPIVGTLSDSLGRWPLLLGCVGFILSGSFVTMAIQFVHAPYTLILLNNLLANAIPIQVMIWTWITDKTPPSSRVPIFGLCAALSDSEGVLCPLIGIFFGDGQLVVFATAAACLAFAIAAGYLPESLPPKHRQPLQCSLGAACGPLASLGRILMDPNLRSVLCANIMVIGCQTAFNNNFLLFMEERFGTGRQGAAPLLLCSGLVALFTQVFLLKPLNDAGGLGLVLAIGVVCLTVGYGAFPFFNSTLCWVSMTFAGLGTMTSAALIALVANLCPANERGGIMGAFIALMQLGAVVVVVCFDRLHAFFAAPNRFLDSPFPGLPLVPCALLEAASMLHLYSNWGGIQEAVRGVEEAGATSLQPHAAETPLPAKA